MKKVIYILALIIVLVICFEILQMIITNKYYHINELFLLATLLISIFYRTRVTWLLVLVICLLGAFNLMFIQPKYSSPTIFNFTYTVYRLLMTEFNHMSIVRVLKIFPILFYLFTAIVFLTKPIRNKYWPQSKREDGIKMEHGNL